MMATLIMICLGLKKMYSITPFADNINLWFVSASSRSLLVLQGLSLFKTTARKITRIQVLQDIMTSVPMS